jgi:hypothetical protein
VRRDAKRPVVHVVAERRPAEAVTQQ